MFKKIIKTMIIVSILILLSLGGYFTYHGWQKYQTDSAMQIQFKNLQLLQSLEYAVMNEVVCKIAINENKILRTKICQSAEETSDTMMKYILMQKDNLSLHDIQAIIIEIRESIQKLDLYTLERLIDGDLAQSLHAFIQEYITTMKLLSDDMHQKQYLHYYGDILNKVYYSELENAFVAYTLTLKKTINTKALNDWNDMIDKSDIPDAYRYALSFLHTNIEEVLEKENIQVTLDGIQEIRFDMMAYSLSGKYSSSVTLWMALINHKLKVLENVNNMLLRYMLDDVVKALTKSKSILFLSLVVLMFMLLAMAIWGVYFVQAIRKKEVLENFINKIKEHTSTPNHLSIRDEVLSYEAAYDYVSIRYESLHLNLNKIKNENEKLKNFLHTKAYQISRPLNGLLGYTKLLKETGLSIEQHDFILPLEHNINTLEKILFQIGKEPYWYKDNIEIVNETFDIIKQIESTVETLTIKMDRKDILLSFYVDPELFYEVKGDSTKISQIMSNLIENALEASSVNDSIDIVLEKVESNAQTLGIKFSIRDYGMGYDEDKISRIYESFKKKKVTRTIANLDMINLNMSNNILEQMDSKLELSSEKGKGTHFFFTLYFAKSKQISFLQEYPRFEGINVGIAIPNMAIHRKIDKSLERYVLYLGGRVKRYDYATLLDTTQENILPDLMFVYHNYTRIKSELKNLSQLDCKVVLLTSGSLRSTVVSEKYDFTSIIYAPITLKKIVRIFVENALPSSKNAKNLMLEK